MTRSGDALSLLQVARRGMWFLLVVLLLAPPALSLSRLTAQDDPFRLTGQIEAGDFRSLAVTDSERLLVADGENRQVRIYNLSTEPPAVVATIDVGGEPLQVAAAGDYGAVVTRTGGESDLLQTVARSAYGRRPWEVVLQLEIAPSPHTLVTSPDGRWGIMAYDDHFALLDFISSDDIGSNDFGDAIVDAAFDGQDRVYLLTNAPSVVRATLGDGPSLTVEETLTLPQPAAHLAVTGDGTRGALSLAGGNLAAFDPAAMTLGESFSGQGGAPQDLQFFTLGDTPWLVTSRVGDTSVGLVEFSDPGSLTSQPLDIGFEMRALTTAGERLIISSSTRVSIFTP